VGDRAAEGALLPRALGIDVDPLVVTRRLGEPVHLLLGDLHPVAVAEVLADQALHTLDALHGGLRHEMPPLRID
jgi:hypothetical protein